MTIHPRIGCPGEGERGAIYTATPDMVQLVNSDNTITLCY